MLDLRTKRQHVSAFLLRLGKPYPESKKTWNQGACELDREPEARAPATAPCAGGDDAGDPSGAGGACNGWSRPSPRPFPRMVACRGGHRLDGHARHRSDLGPQRCWPRSAILSRFQTPTELMAYLGLVPSENSTGDTVKRGPITKAGNRRARRMLVECSWSYQHPPRVGQAKQPKVDAAPPAVRENRLGRRSAGYIGAIARWSGRASSRPSPSSRSRASSPASSGRVARAVTTARVAAVSA